MSLSCSGRSARTRRSTNAVKQSPPTEITRTEHSTARYFEASEKEATLSLTQRALQGRAVAERCRGGKQIGDEMLDKVRLDVSLYA